MRKSKHTNYNIYLLGPILRINSVKVDNLQGSVIFTTDHRYLYTVESPAIQFI